MAGEASTVGAGRMLDAVTGRATLTARTTYLVALTAAPTDATTLANMAEVTTAGYSRPAAAWTVPTGDPQVTSNTAQVSFGTFTADPPQVGWVALVSAASGTTGDFLYWWVADLARDAASGDSLVVAAGALVMQLD